MKIEQWTIKDELAWLDTLGMTHEETRREPLDALLRGYLIGLQKRVRPPEFVAERPKLIAKASRLLSRLERSKPK